MPSLNWMLILVGIGYVAGRSGEAIIRWAWAQYKAWKSGTVAK